MKRQILRMGMIGGGPGSFIGAIHRTAAQMDSLVQLVCGTFSSKIEKSQEMGRELSLSPNRIYRDYEEMIRRESELPADERMDFVSIVTPNHVHFAPAAAALRAGFHVVLDKPMTLTLEESRELAKIIDETNMFFCLTHTYTGYPMVKQARQMVLNGDFGKIRKVYVEYPQGWLSTPLEQEGNKQAGWRTDPSKSGKGGAMGDIGTHAFNLAEYASGLKVSHLCADLHTKVPNRVLDDDGAMLLRFENGASGVLMATQIAAGEENNIKVRVYGEKGGLEWQQEDPNTLQVKWLDKPKQIYRTGTPYVSSYASANARTPAGHPEGYLEAFANHYRNFSRSLLARLNGEEPEKEWLDYPGTEDGLRGMAFVELAVENSKQGQKWTEFKV
ncbi:Gfo/Idh/MocA family protein [Roseivirga sp. BDSF3-8]|uniref:Gfo/Idh/MocA family protein n=1 Tax=Roseivirga sp. BDSF3-8 TaxID=3241598 RepID=UPI0035324F83